MWELYRPWENAAFTQFEGPTALGRARPGSSRTGCSRCSRSPGSFFVHRRGLTLIPLLAQIVLVTAISAIAYGSVRFRLPAEVVIVSLAALTIDTAVGWVARRRRRDAATA